MKPDLEELLKRAAARLQDYASEVAPHDNMNDPLAMEIRAAIDGPLERPPFDQETMFMCQEFAHELLQTIPEMEGVAIIPSWVVQQEHVPYGVVVGRNGPLRSPTEIQHMAVQVHGCLRQQLENAYNVLLGLDAEMGKMAEELRAKHEQLTDLNMSIATAHLIAEGQGVAPDPGSGAAPSSP